MKTALLSAVFAAGLTLVGAAAASAEPSAAIFFLGDTGLRLPVSALTAPEPPPTTVEAAPATQTAAPPRKVRVVLASPFTVR